MAGKSSKSSSSKSSARKNPIRAALKPRAAKKASPKKPRSTSGARPTPRKTGEQKQPARSSQSARPVASGLSLDRKLDILGVVLALGGLLTLLSLLSMSRSGLTQSWVQLIAMAFGWGKFIFPVGLLVSGLWLVLRSFDRIPQLAVERLVGILLLFFNLLAVFHFIAFLQNPGQDTLVMAGEGLGGGYTGAVTLNLLLRLLGRGGAAIVLAAWLLIALAMTFDLTVAEMFGWIGPLFTRTREWLIERWPERKTPPYSPSYNGSPFPPAKSSASTSSPGAHPVVAVSPPGASQELEMEPSLEAEPRQWVLPNIAKILDPGGEVAHDDDIDRQRAQIIEETLSSFGAPARVVEINRGPTITQFGVEPDFVESRGGRMRVRVGKIAALADDLALALSARTIRIQAPVPGKGFVGIEVPNDEIALVALRDVIESEAFKRIKSPLGFALGQNVAGMAVAADLAAMPHLLIAGQTGSGKSVAVNSLICCLLLNNTPDELRLIMVDPKRVELTGYNGIPHLLAPVVVEMERVVAALQWVTREMDMRYRKLAEVGARNIKDFNLRAAQRGLQKIPYLVVIIDELADLMMLAPDETERTITRLAQLARATGIHLVIATQRPSVDVVTGLIKANFPARIAFAVASNVDSRTILDQPGAERLLGRGDMLFLPPDAPAPVRLQGVFVSDAEIQRLVQYWQGFSSTALTTQVAVGGIVDALPSNLPLKQLPMWEEAASEEEQDPLYKEAIDLVRRQGRASISMLQRRMRIGYTRAARLVETMEAKGIVGPPEPGTGAREVLDYGPAAPPVDDEVNN